MSRSRDKGTAWESAVVDWLRTHGFPFVERRALCGARDKGDVAGIPGLVVECKWEPPSKIASWVNEAKAEAANAGVADWVVFAHRHGKASPEDCYVLISAATFARLFADEPAEAAS